MKLTGIRRSERSKYKLFGLSGGRTVVPLGVSRPSLEGGFSEIRYEKIKRHPFRGYPDPPRLDTLGASVPVGSREKEVVP